MSRPRPDVRITDLAACREGDAHRVSAIVDGEAAWFRSEDLALDASPEALATAFLLPALFGGRRLAIDGRVCPRWEANVRELLGLFRRWWGTPELMPATRGAAPLPTPAPRATALCFSGGVDSFHTLLQSEPGPDLLLTVHGFDIPIDDRPRMDAFAAGLDAIAAARGVGRAVVHTNLREHPLMRAAPWERTHGGALAGVGHLLAGRVGRLVISSSISLYSRHESWGSHWRSDPLWSSSRLEVVHVGEGIHRSEKLRAIAQDPLVQRHLRVCWHNLAPTGNCSRCEKCLHAMLVLRECGVLERCAAFEGSGRIVERLDALPRLKGQLGAFDHLSRHGRLSPGEARAVRDLIARTRRRHSAPVRARRAVWRALTSLSRTLFRRPRAG